MLVKRCHRADDGFTLVELVITVAIVGIMIAALGSVMISYLSTSRTSQTRLTESTDQQLISAYWQQDVSSAGVRGFTPTNEADQFPIKQAVWTGTAPSGVPGGCTSGFPGTLVIGFVWNEYPGTTDPATTWDTTTANAAVYSAAANGAQTELYRTRCIGGTTKTNLLARRLTQTPVPACQRSSGVSIACDSTSPVPSTITLALDVADKADNSKTGYTMTLRAQRRQG